ncbi:hypothetical protein [Candidatus Phytoplasma prunorum]|uniref:hypothetical protein n=1 Tax=Candidatus Phytoplasma prunorum TaxID=47565 RepID=UPI002FF42EDF
MIKIILEKILALIGLFFLLFLFFFWVDGIHPSEIFKTVINIPKPEIFNQDSQKNQNELLAT